MPGPHPFGPANDPVDCAPKPKKSIWNAIINVLDNANPTPEPPPPPPPPPPGPPPFMPPPPDHE